MCEESEVPRRKMPFLNRLFDSDATNIPKKIHTYCWHPTAQMALHGGCKSAVLHLRCQSFWDKSVTPPQAIVFSIEE